MLLLLKPDLFKYSPKHLFSCLKEMNLINLLFNNSTKFVIENKAMMLNVLRKRLSSNVNGLPPHLSQTDLVSSVFDSVTQNVCLSSTSCSCSAD